MTETEMNQYATIGDQNNYQGLSAPQPVGNIPTQSGQLSPGYQQQFVPQQGYAPNTQPPPGYAPHTQPQPGYAPQMYMPPEYAQHRYFTESTNVHQTNTNQLAPVPQPVFATPSSGLAPAQAPAYNGHGTGQQVVTRTTHSLLNVTDTGSTCWMVVGILTAIFICLPLGVAGAVMAYLSGEEARRGNAAAHKTKICQSKAFTLTGLGTGLLFIITGLTVGLVAINNNYISYDATTPEYTQQWTTEAIYMGCYEDDTIFRDLDGDFYDFGSDNSVAKCSSYCSERGYKYAGLQDGTLCYCGYFFGSNSRLDQTQCDFRCPADNRECGGYLINSVYRTNYLGCFKDISFIAALGDFQYYLDYFDAVPQVCTSKCGDKGFKFAALSGRNCYCSNDPNRFGEVSYEDCDVKCSSNSELLCGGDSEKSVFKTDANSDETYHYLGCYKDLTLADELPEYIYSLDNSPGWCASTCSTRGYRYAGLQSGTECYCGQFYGALGESYDCDTNCPVGNEICGGASSNSVYKTDYFGCFEDDFSIEAMNVSVFMSNYELSPTECKRRCRGQGYLFAGIGQPNGCHCSHDFNRYYQVPDSECDDLCTSDYESTCGGYSKLAVFETGLS